MHNTQQLACQRRRHHLIRITTSHHLIRITTRRLLTCPCCGPLVLAMVPWPQHHITGLTASLDQGVNGTAQHAVRSWQAPHNCKQHHAPHNHLTHPTPHMHTHRNLAMPRELCSQRDPSLSPAAALGPRPSCHGPRVTGLITSTRRPWCAFTCASTKERKERENSVIVSNTPCVIDYHAAKQSIDRGSCSPVEHELVIQQCVYMRTQPTLLGGCALPPPPPNSYNAPVNAQLKVVSSVLGGATKQRSPPGCKATILAPSPLKQRVHNPTFPHNPPLHVRDHRTC